MKLLHSFLVGAVAGWHRLPKLVRWLGPCAVMVTLWWTSSQTPKDSPPSAIRAWLHNGAHVIAYGGLGGAWLTALMTRVGDVLRLGRRRVAAAVLLTIAYGIVDEVHQSFVPKRDASVLDVLTDTTGSLLAVVLVGWALQRDPRLPRFFPWLVLLAAACVSAATWLPL